MSTNFPNLIAELRTVYGMTLEQIANACGFSSKGHVHDLKTGRQQSVSYELGTKLIDLHRLKTFEAAAKTLKTIPIPIRSRAPEEAKES